MSPTQKARVIVADDQAGERVLDSFRWGLVPFWAKDIAIGSKMINARVETVATKPAYSRLLSRRRCVVPSTGFFEWKGTKATGKQPFYFSLRSDQIFGFAGLWDTWTSPEGDVVSSYTIITGEPNTLVSDVHDRMPVILADKVAEDSWLDPSITASADLMDLLMPYPHHLMKAIPVSTRVNSPANDDPSLIEPISLV